MLAGPKEDSLKVKAEIALAGMRAVVTTGDVHLKRLRKRATLASNLKLSAQIVTLLASSAVLAGC